MNFSAMTAVLDIEVEDHLCDDALWLKANGDPASTARVMVDKPVDIERLQGMGFSRARTVLRVSVRTATSLIEGDTFHISDEEIWRVASAPTRSDDGRWWEAEVEPG